MARSNIVLHDGKELTIDLNAISMREYRDLFKSEQSDEYGDYCIAKCVGLTAEQLLDLSQPDYRRVMKAFFEVARDPLADIDNPKA